MCLLDFCQKVACSEITKMVRAPVAPPAQQTARTSRSKHVSSRLHKRITNSSIGSQRVSHRAALSPTHTGHNRTTETRQRLVRHVHVCVSCAHFCYKRWTMSSISRSSRQQPLSPALQCIEMMKVWKNGTVNSLLQ